MSESRKHIYLVQKCYEYILAHVPEGNESLVLKDSPDELEKPPINRDGYRPDVLYQRGDLLIIGDAKTAGDIDSPHSKTQIKSFLKECSVHLGNALFVLAVPFCESESACYEIAEIKYRENLQVAYTVINEEGVFEEQWGI